MRITHSSITCLDVGWKVWQWSVMISSCSCWCDSLAAVSSIIPGVVLYQTIGISCAVQPGGKVVAPGRVVGVGGGSKVPCLFRSIVLGGWPNTKRAPISVEALIICALMIPGSFVPVITCVPPSGYPVVGCPSLSILLIVTSKGGISTSGVYFNERGVGRRDDGAVDEERWCWCENFDGYRRVGAQADPPTDVGGENPGKIVPRFEIQKTLLEMVINRLVGLIRVSIITAP
ncbi:hypothetical protein F2Q70_00020145 [Brassica cretica]|uniref:Uncharacterized protein n=1 Tax=Brassica cretica TaxID=69181 RepID=A0A8S9GL45_BRACR|nr:hypothetical protein F2Q70_00020145 [Brassica cretica]